MNLRHQIKQVTKYHSDITDGYLLSEKQLDRIMELIENHYKTLA